MKYYFIIFCLCCSIFSLGMTFAPTKNTLEYNNLQLGDTYEDMINQFGTPRYSENNYLWGQKITYYVYKNNNKIGINDDTQKIVDIIIVDDTYNHHDNLKMGLTRFKIEQIFGPADRQLFDGHTCYIYQTENNQRLIIQVEPTEKYLESFRITLLPIELPIDTTAYVPDDVTDETENPLIGDKQIDTSSVDNSAKDRFSINYNYSFTK